MIRDYAKLEAEVYRLKSANSHWHTRVQTLLRDNETLLEKVADAEKLEKVMTENLVYLSRRRWKCGNQ